MLVLAFPSHKMGGHFRVLRDILWKRVNASVSFSRGRRSTLQCGVWHLRGRRSILWRVQNVFFMNRIGRAVQT